MEAARRAPVYLQAAEIDDPPPPFRTGEAGLVWVGGAGTLETDARVPLSANAVAALFGHGVIDELNRLALEGRLGSGRDAILPQGILEKAAAILYEADRKTYGGTWEFVVDRAGDPEPVEYRVRVDNREYQRSLLRLTDLLTLASRNGHAVRMRL